MMKDCEYILKDDFESICEVRLVDKRRAELKLSSPRRNNYMSAFKSGGCFRSQKDQRRMPKLWHETSSVRAKERLSIREAT